MKRVYRTLAIKRITLSPEQALLSVCVANGVYMNPTIPACFNAVEAGGSTCTLAVRGVSTNTQRATTSVSSTSPS